MNVSPPDAGAFHFVVGITGDGRTNAAIAIDRELVADALRAIFAEINDIVALEARSAPGTSLGVALPTLGASIAGIRFFGDFERFAAISEVTAPKLEHVQARIDRRLKGPLSAIDYAGVSRLAHEIDESEIESWQEVSSGKHVALPA